MISDRQALIFLAVGIGMLTGGNHVMDPWRIVLAVLGFLAVTVAVVVLMKCRTFPSQ